MNPRHGAQQLSALSSLRPVMPALLPATLLVALVAVLLGGCLGGSRPDKPPGMALWLTRDSPELSPSAQTRLAALGLKEIYFDAADLQWNAGPHLAKLDWPTVPRRTPVTLVIRGVWQPGDRPPEQLATALSSQLSSLRIEAEHGGLVVNGFHFEVAPADAAESLGTVLSRLRSQLGAKLFVSAGLNRNALEGPGAKAVAGGVDFIVSLLYGQRSGEAEDPTAWDLMAVEENFRRLEALGKPYFTGAVTLGTARWRDRSGGIKGVTTELALGDLVGGHNLELQRGFSLEGVDRQVWEWKALGPATVGAWNLAKGESVRVVRTATPFMEEFRRRVGAWESTKRRGEVFYRLPRENEKLSLSVDNLVEVLAPDAAAPKLEVSLERLETTATRWKLRVHLENPSSESTDLAYFDSNYVEIAVQGATIGEVERGEFQRTEVLADGERGTMRAYREANMLRLYLPLVEEHHAATSGAIELKLTQRKPVVTTSASFLLADGQTLAIAPQEWQFEKP